MSRNNEFVVLQSFGLSQLRICVIYFIVILSKYVVSVCVLFPISTYYKEKYDHYIEYNLQHNYRNGEQNYSWIILKNQEDDNNYFLNFSSEEENVADNLLLSQAIMNHVDLFVFNNQYKFLYKISADSIELSNDNNHILRNSIITYPDRSKKNFNQLILELEVHKSYVNSAVDIVQSDQDMLWKSDLFLSEMIKSYDLNISSKDLVYLLGFPLLYLAVILIMVKYMSEFRIRDKQNIADIVKILFLIASWMIIIRVIKNDDFYDYQELLYAYLFIIGNAICIFVKLYDNSLNFYVRKYKNHNF